MKRKRYVVLFVVSIILLIGPKAVFSQQGPESQQFKNITAESLKALMDKNTKMMVVDARTEKEYLQGHIPGAVNIDPDKFSFISGYLPKDKSMLIVFYCRGAT